MESDRIYILEDDLDIANLYSRELTAHNFHVEVFGTINLFTSALKVNRCDLCVIDLSLPDGDALALLRDTLVIKSIPTIIVSGRGSVQDRVLGLDVGADDYLVKPIDMIELAARIRSLLRRVRESRKFENPSSHYSFSGWSIDFSTYQLLSPSGEVQNLSASDARLLKAFVDCPGKILTRNTLLDVCQLQSDDVADRSIDVRISRLRKKIGDDSRSSEFIKTVYGAGYLFTAIVKVER